MEKSEYPKWLYHADGRSLLVGSFEEHVEYAEWAESPEGPFGAPPLPAVTPSSAGARRQGRTERPA